MHRRVSYEIYRTRGSFYVTRVADGEEHVSTALTTGRGPRILSPFSMRSPAHRGASRCIDPIGRAPNPWTE
jgi:hypothetical protein